MVCEMVTKDPLEFLQLVRRDVTWIKIEALSYMVFAAMHDRARPFAGTRLRLKVRWAMCLSGPWKVAESGRTKNQSSDPRSAGRSAPRALEDEGDLDVVHRAQCSTSARPSGVQVRRPGPRDLGRGNETRPEHTGLRMDRAITECCLAWTKSICFEIKP